MNGNILAWLKYPVGDAAFYAGFGFLFVFLGIALLIIILTCMGKGIDAWRGRKKKKKKSEPVEQVIPPQKQAEDGISPETVAVIAAAIAAYEEKEGGSCGFIVKRIRKI